MRDVRLDPETLARFGEVLRRDAGHGVIPGAVVRVTRHGQVAWQEVVGHAQPGLAMQADSVFRIAAMTRPVVAAAALSLVESGQLSLHEPVAAYLPELARVQVGVEEGDGASRRLALRPPRRAMTVIDLLRHTAGFTYGMFGDSLVQRLYREADVMSPAQTNAEMVSKLAALPLQWDPGAAFEYGMSTDVLGRVLEVATGQGLDEVLAQRITRPLGLSRTDFAFVKGELALPRAGAPAAVLFDYDPARPPAWCSGGAGLLSTAEDYTRFCRMLLQGGELDGIRVLSPQSVALMLADQLPEGIAYGTSTRGLGINAPLPELGQGHGLGVGIRCRPGLSPVPGSVGDFFWGGALGTYFWADPKEQLVAVLMLQETDTEARARYRAMLRHAVYGAPWPAPLRTPI